MDRVANGVTIYRLLPDGLGTVERLADGLDLGGIDTHLYGSLGPARLHVCGANRCYSIGDGGYRQDWELAPLSSFEFVEVAIRGTQAVAILRRKHDDRFDGEPGSSFSEYFIAEFTHTGNVRIVPVARGIPWRLRFGPFGARYSLASTPGDLRRLFYHDLNRLTHEGSKDLATNNLEGRIAWSQFYYLNAMVSLFNPQLEWLLPDNRNALRARLQSELALLTQFCQDGYPGLLVRRYSYNREPLLIALHLGRVAQLLKRAESFESAGSSRDCRHWLSERLTQLDTTLEETYATTTDDGRPGTYVRFRRGEDFWADGVNVPYNYVSAIAGGLISLDAGNRRAAAEYMSFLVDNEFSAKRPRSWRYWWGIGDAGWSVEDGFSKNTPAYTGNARALAHITYRTMDATTLAQIAYELPDAIPRDLVQHFRFLTKSGWLLPSMNEFWAGHGGVVSIDGAVARRFARSAGVWELQSQVWALHSLASGPVGN